MIRGLKILHLSFLVSIFCNNKPFFFKLFVRYLKLIFLFKRIKRQDEILLFVRQWYFYEQCDALYCCDRVFFIILRLLYLCDFCRAVYLWYFLVFFLKRWFFKASMAIILQIMMIEWNRFCLINVQFCGINIINTFLIIVKTIIV